MSPIEEVRAMKAVIPLLLVLATVTLASGGQNPRVFAYVDFDPPHGVHRVDPELYEVVHAHFMLDCIQGDFSNISVALYVSPEMSLNTGYDNALPNGFYLGDGFEEGITIGSFDCLSESPLAFAIAHIVYSGVPGDVMIIDHPTWPRWVVDCSQPYPDVDYYCLLSQGGVGKDPEPTGEMCGCPTPVEDASWGSIKALFR
jgi:hypothetical protein